mgnify:CR=1 FL=1
MTDRVPLIRCFNAEDFTPTHVILPPVDSVGKVPVTVGVIFGPFDSNKTHKPTSNPAIPWEFSFIIGRIATAWGAFEIRFDHVLECMFNHSPKPLKHEWRRMNFRKRRELFREQTSACFHGHIRIEKYLQKLCNDAGTSYWKRNLTLHGKIDLVIEYKIKVKIGEQISPKCFLRIRGRHNEKDIEYNCDYDHMEGLFYEITHLHGRLDFASAQPIAENSLLSAQDISILRDFVLANQKSPPSAPTPSSLLQSSPP